jgi:DNA-binding GntR family transcriptional regulator
MRERDGDRAAALVSSHIRATNARLLARLDEQRRPLRVRGVAVIGSVS